LRRGRRRLEAREPLRLAIAAFEGLGLEAWSQRAQSELRASGGEAATPDRVDLDVLTAQELEIARMVSRGGSNREVAASLTLSPRTIEYHLSKIYVKLGISSRGELANVLPVETDRPLR
jgi:DNA-binding NarL/FixJ family response regulator